MSRAEAFRERAVAMRAELEPMSRSAALGWGKRCFSGTDALFARLEHAPDGTPSDMTAEAEALVAWADWLREFAEIIRDKPPTPPRMVRLKKLR
jgi:hypothetical protein